MAAAAVAGVAQGASYVCRVGRLNIGQELIGFGLQGAPNERRRREPWMPVVPSSARRRAQPGQRAHVAFYNSFMGYSKEERGA